MIILGIDPGEKESHLVVWNTEIEKIEWFRTLSNDLALIECREVSAAAVGVEVVRGYGLSVGNSTLITAEWAGRFMEAVNHRVDGWHIFAVPRKTKDGSVHALCGHDNAGDSGVFQALKDRYGEPGTKKAPNVLYGLNVHHRAALAVALKVVELLKEGIKT